MHPQHPFIRRFARPLAVAAQPVPRELWSDTQPGFAGRYYYSVAAWQPRKEGDQRCAPAPGGPPSQPPR